MESPRAAREGEGGSRASGRTPPPEDRPWARALRLRLATQLREAGRAEPKQVEALLRELLALFQLVLRRSSRAAWLRLMEALALVAPFRQLLSGRAELAPFLKSVYYQYYSSQALISDLDVLGAIKEAFPKDCSLLWASPKVASPRNLADAAKLLPSSQEPVFAGLPCPFQTSWTMPGSSGMLQPDPVSLQELQRSVGPVSSEVAHKETPWASSLGLMPLTLAAVVPVEYSCSEQSSVAQSSVEAGIEHLPLKKTAAEPEAPITGLQAAEIFARKHHSGEINFLYLNVAHNRHFRPYDLITVPKQLINSRHYVFSPFGVLSVHPEEGSEALSLGDWHREAMLWQLLQYIPFFRLFLVRKAFARWYFNVKHLQFLKRREKLRVQLLQAVPHFGAALLHISRLLQELQAVHWLPTNNSKCYNFPELKGALDQENSNAQGLLRKFLSLCSSILELVRDDTYKMVHGLQMEVQGYQLYITKESLYQQRVQYEKLQDSLQDAESWLQKLGALAQLVNFLICQTLVSVMQEEVADFVNCTMKADGSLRKAVLRVQLVFGADNALMLFPSGRELDDCLLGALHTVLESVLETTRIREKVEIQAGPQTPAAAAEQGVLQPGAVSVASIGTDGELVSFKLSERFQGSSVMMGCNIKDQLVHRLDLKATSGLEVVGHRLRGEYPLLSREQLETDLKSDSIIQKAVAKQHELLTDAMAETQLLCREYSWLGQIYQFVHSWSSVQLENMKGWPAEDYVNQILKLRTWVVQVQKVPHVVITYNHLFLVDCSGIHQDILPILASISEDILTLLLSETTKRSELFIAELASVLQLYVNVGTDIFTIAKCSQKLEQYQGQMTELQEYVDYVRALNEVIQKCFRPLSPSEESLENTFSASLAMEKTEEWQKEVINLGHSLPSNHPVLQACLHVIVNFHKYLPLLLKLGSHFFYLSCWKEIFAVMGVKCPLNMQFTLGQLLSYPLLEHSDSIFRVYAYEKSRHYARDTLLRLERTWVDKQFRLVNFILNVPYQEPQPERFRRTLSGHQRTAKLEYISKDSGTYVLSDTTELKASVEHSILTLQNMILSPFSADILEEAESWASTLRTFESLLDAWVSFQQKWVFLNIVLYEMNITLPSAELDSQFQQADAYFRKVMQLTCNDPLVLSSVRLGASSTRDSRFIGSALQAAFLDGSEDLQVIIRALDYVLEAIRMGFPRLFFLSNEELVAMLSTASEAADASAWSQRCFPGVCRLELFEPFPAQSHSSVSTELQEVQVTGLVGNYSEKLKLCSVVSLSRKATQWLCTLEQCMKESVFNQLQECVVQRLTLRPQLDLAFEHRPGPKDLPLHLVAECWALLENVFPTQCVLLAEQALWRVVVEEAFLHPHCLQGLELKLSLKLEAVAHYVRNYRSTHAWKPERDHLGMLLGALIVLTIQQRDVLALLLKHQVTSASAFDWARHLKYCVSLLPEKAQAARLPSSTPWVGSLPGCWAEILGSRFPYDYEYLGPGLQLLGSPALESTFLGLLLALEEFRCGGLLGCPDVGKSHTVQGLAQFLGRQLVTLHCTVQMSIRCLSRYLCGAVHAGALLLLESVEQLELAVLSAFSHCLTDLQRMCLNLQEGRVTTQSQSSTVLPFASPGSESSDSSEESEEPPMIPLPELGTDEAKPYQPRVLGNIMFGERLLRVRETYGCVMTLKRLPEPLRVAVRPLAMLPPDLTRLAEVTLLAAGFREAGRLAEKLCAFLNLERMLNPGPHLSHPALIRKVAMTAVDILFASSAAKDKCSTRTTFLLGLEEEPAIVKALCLSPLLSGPEGPRLHNVRELLHEVFPTASLLPSEQVPPRLQRALVSQLNEDKLQSDPDLLRAAGRLSQAVQRATGVILLGPAGSGKTTTWRTLAKAQSRLAASDATPRTQNFQADKMVFRPISTVCLWPNALSTSEFVGSLEGSIWQDGVFSRVLQRAATSALACGTGQGSPQQWVVLDGATCTQWLEPISLLFSSRSFFSLPNGQKLQVPENIRFLFEMLDASGMTPSVCTHCALLPFEGSKLWQVLLSSAMAPVYRKCSLTQETLATLHSLAKELFPATLAFLQQHCSPVLLPHAYPQNPVTQGVQETMSFTRIFHALLEQYLHRDRNKHLSAAQESTDIKARVLPLTTHSLDEMIPAHHHHLAQSIFVFAYIWGFGSHLHTRYWPLFDHFVRRALRNSSCSIELPPAVSAFDLCPLAEDGTLEPFDGRYLLSRIKSVPVSFSILPQYERVLFVLDLLLGTEQPVLLVGEAGCGKSTFAEMLVQPMYSYHRLCLTPAFRAAHLRQLLHRRSLNTVREKGLFPMGKPAQSTASKGRFLFMVEDLHLAYVDKGRGTSPVIESLRQTLTLQLFYHAETLELQHCPATGFSCFGTLSFPVTGALPLCPRFGRLFSTVVLPAMARESLLSLHAGTVLAWLEKFPLLSRHNDLAFAIVRATLDTYEAVRSRFQPSPACCLFQFSLHDISKVIRGMLLLRPRPGIHLSSPLEDHSSRMPSSRRTSALGRMAGGTGYSAVLSIRLIVRLWMHECLRVFCDPLRGKQQQDLCGQILMEIATATFCAKRCILRVVPSIGVPSRTRTAVQFFSPSPSCTDTAAVEEENPPKEEHLLPTTQAEPDYPSSSEAGCWDPWGPVGQAAALALDPPAPPLWEDPALGEPGDEVPEAEPEDGEGVKKHPGTLPAAPHPPFLLRARHHTSSKKESSGPLLPSHLLLLQGESLADLVFSKDLGPSFYALSAHNPYQEKTWKGLESQLGPSLPPGFLLYSEGLKHVVRLARLLCGPDRHGALVSFVRCTGRQSLVALVAHATDSLLMNLPAKTTESEALTLLRLASWQAGITGRQVLLLVHSGVSVAVMHQILALMAEGTCPGLYGPEDFMAILQALLQENQGIKRTMREDLILQKFFQFVRSNLHVLLLLGGPGSLALPPLMAVSLSQWLCYLEIYQSWSLETLLGVASRHLKDHFKNPLRLTRELWSLHAQKDLLHRIAEAAAHIHSSAAQYATSLAANLPLVSPKSFLDFLDSFVLLLDNLQEQTNQQADRMKLVLQKMGEVSKRQQEHTRDVHLLKQKLVKIKEEMAQSQKEVAREQAALRQHEKECQVYEARIDALSKKREALEKKKELAMKKVSQDYKAALASLGVQDIEELRSYRQPPASVIQVTDALCLMFHVEPGWESAKLLLNREEFYQELVFYPKDSLSTELFQALGKIVCHKAFSVANIQSASQATAALFQWISAIYWYHWALREWQPAMLQLQSCDDQINTEKINLGDQRLKSEYLKDTTQARIRELKLKQEHQEKLLQQLTQSLQAKEDATTMESSVAELLVSWTTLAKDLEYHQSTVHGDALLCSAVITYLGPFSPSRRKELLEKWQAVCDGSRVSLGPDDISWLLQKELPCPGPSSSGPPLLAVQKPLNLVSLLSSTQEQRLWNRVHKPKDAESRLTAMIINSSVHLQAHRWPLLVDPDKQALVWLLMSSALEDEESQTYDLVPDMVEQGGCDEMPEDKLEILSLTNPDLEQSLSNAASLGNPVLLMDFEKNISWCPTLQQLIKKKTFQRKEVKPLLHSEEKVEELECKLASQSISLYLSTELPMKALAAEVDHALLKHLNVIDLSLSHGALEDQLLNEVLRIERREILKNQQALYLGILQLEGKLEATEEELVDLISQPQRSLLEEENFTPMMQLLQAQIQALRATHRNMVSQYQDQAALCDKYRQLARLGVALHQALEQVGCLHPLYHFPTELYISHMRQALLSVKRQETIKQKSLEARLLELSRMVLQQLLTQALPCLREMDRLLYFFLGAAATLRVAGEISSMEWLAFCQGLRDPAAVALLLPGSSVRCPSWVPAEAWEECALLENLPGFEGLLASLAEKAVQWQEYFRLPSTIIGPALCPSHTHLSLFQRAILWRILCPHAMSQVIAELTTCLLGWSFTEEMAAVSPYAYSRANKPVIFVTAPSGSPTTFTNPLLWIQQMAAQRGRLGRIVVISFGTPDAFKRVWRALQFCTKKGKWLVLNNCQLLEHWDSEVLLQLNLVLNTPAGQGKEGALEVHPKFRLWLITTADASDSVPGPVHRSATTLFCEMPLELKGLLAHTHSWLQGQVQSLDTEKRLSLLVLYGVLIYRQNYVPWAQTTPYLWSHVELLAGIKALEKLSQLAQSSEEAQQQLAGTMLYGGHVLDTRDAEAVQSICQQCLASASCQPSGSGLQSLLAAVVGHPRAGLLEEEMSAATQASIQRLPSPMEPAWVGLCSGLRPQMLARRSKALLSALKACQGWWQPQGPLAPQPQRGLEQLVKDGLLVVEQLQERLERCGWEVGSHGHPPPGQPRPKPRPLQRFVLEEAGGFLALLKQVGQDLQCTQERLQGTPCSSHRCSAIHRDLEQGQLPGCWRPYAPTGPEPLQGWLHTLQLRCDLLCHYLQSVEGRPVAQYQLAAFQQPQGLLLALLQEKARVERQELDCFHLEQQVLPSTLPPGNPPEHGLYLSGLELCHASWSTLRGQMQETLSAQPCRLPPVWVQASQEHWGAALALPQYQCPVYLGAAQAPTDLRSQQVIMHLLLPSEMSIDLCAQRRVYAISLLQ